jgi:AraC family transcriptional regulator of adaptative response / DNA-3-methyladenine glycosylase II
MKKEDIYYKAMLARDHRFDGKFFIGVKTTGIYCRPVCPAKPKRENVEFFSSYLLAEKAGYRPCLRCRPESAPGSPVWIGTSAVVQRGIRLIQNLESLKFNEDDFALKFGVSARHLRRLFQDEIGKTPKQLAFENRLNLARKLITETNLPVTEVAYSSGFESIRRFNDAFKKRFKKKPTELRKKKQKGDASLSLTLSYRPPYDFKGLLAFYHSHQVGALELVTEDSYQRIFEFGGSIGKVIVTDRPEISALNLVIEYQDSTCLMSVLSRIRNMFDLDSDPVIIANTLEKDKGIKKLLHKYPGIRIPSGWDGLETAAATILGQFVSVEHGRKLVSDLINIAGKKKGDITFFPSPQEILAVDLSRLKTTRARKETLKELMKAIIEHKISLEETQPPEEFQKSVMAIKGIGAWTASYMALKVLRHADAFPETDLIIKRALNLHSKEKINELAPWRGYVTTLLWKEYYRKVS